MTDNRNRRVVLANRPVGSPTLGDFRIEEAPRPVAGPGEVVVRNLLLSLDPYMRGRMSDQASYAAPVALGAPMPGGTVARVIESQHPGFAAGALVLAYGGWQEFSRSDGSDLSLLPADLPRLSYALGVLGMPGYTAYHGLLRIGAPQPGETVVVGAATGAVGSVVGQIAKLKGCRVVGIAGGAAKCEYAVNELLFDACLDHHQPDLAARLSAACPAGIDVYFESVGGAVLEAVLPQMNVGGRIPVCGLMAFYNATALPAGPDKTLALMRQVLVRRLKLQGFIISDQGAGVGEFQRDMRAWLGSGAVRYREHAVRGIENAPAAFIDLLRGGNFGKALVEIADA